jgi:pyrroline-5-carboxylate reductase
VHAVVRLSFLKLHTLTPIVFTSPLPRSSGPTKVTIMSDNQEILDNATLIFLCVLPALVPEVLKSLKFDASKHTLVSLVSTSTVASLQELASLPVPNVFKMICLPSVATHNGTCLLTPPDQAKDFLFPIFKSLGACLNCETEKQLTTLMVPSCMMGPFYAMLKNTTDWLEAQGINPDDASLYVGRAYMGMAKDAVEGCESSTHFKALIEEQTPGGINAMSIDNCNNLGVNDHYNTAMDGVLERLEGRGNGQRGAGEKK